MLKLVNGLTLYHGSYCEVNNPQLEKCEKRKAFGIMGSKEADEFCIRRLLPNKLKNQYCFKTIKALECLQFMESEKIWLKK